VGGWGTAQRPAPIGKAQRVSGSTEARRSLELRRVSGFISVYAVVATWDFSKGFPWMLSPVTTTRCSAPVGYSLTCTP
jgi:hypothetical protein